MHCLFAVLSWFVHWLTTSTSVTSPTYKYCTVPYGLVYEKKNRSLVFSGSRKIPTLGSTVQWETRLAEFPSGTVGPRVGIFLSPLNTNDGFYLSLRSLSSLGKPCDANRWSSGWIFLSHPYTHDRCLHSNLSNLNGMLDYTNDMVPVNSDDRDELIKCLCSMMIFSYVFDDDILW